MDVAYGVTRNNRSVNTLAYFGGATLVQANRTHHGVSVDLICFVPEKLQTQIGKFMPVIKPLWDNRIELTNCDFRKGLSHAKAA